MWRGHAPCGAGAAVPRDGSQSHTSRQDSLPPVVAGLRTRLDLDEDPPPYRNTPARIRPGINPGATSNKPAEAGWRGPPSNVAREMLSFLEESASESGCARLGVRNGSVHARGTVARCDQSRNRSWPCQLRHQHECRIAFVLLTGDTAVRIFRLLRKLGCRPRSTSAQPRRPLNDVQEIGHAATKSHAIWYGQIETNPPITATYRPRVAYSQRPSCARSIPDPAGAG
jgi:hypothetical protein